ncbi:MAG TPA: protein translocase subunit SecD [Candidatus Acidoferrum sp.]|nr:protein translocase subunit SecD [Candidatus Acidoferrum sp.]
MKTQNNRWKLALVLLVIAWSFYEMYPPTGRSLAKQFQVTAMRKDAEFAAIVNREQAFQRERPERPFANLKEAVGTNDISRYFPAFAVKDQANPTQAILNRLQQQAAGKIKLGLDLQGGTSFLVGIDTNHLAADTNASLPHAERVNQALSQAAEVLRKRVDRFGVAEPVIQPAGSDRILVQLPGLSDSDKDSARAQIQKAAYLEFRLVAPDSDSLVEQGTTEPGYEFLRHPHKASDGRDVPGYLVKKRPELTGKYVKAAFVVRDQFGRPEINFTLTPDGAAIFGDVTRENVHRQLGIVLDGELQSAPVINGPIEGGNGQITGQFTDQEAHALANVLQNPLQVPVSIRSESSVDPTLGKDTIRSGISSAIYGTIAVAGFMVVYYLFAGFVADIALLTNIIILLGVMCSVGTTLTLPGIAGVVLTIGMAVDANVLIFERIREELSKGKSLRGALAAGYERAFRTIFDSHVTTLISSIILIYMGTGPIKGFGVTLTIGVAASLFTALVVTRLIFDFLLARGWLKSLPMLHLIRAANFNFMKFSRFAFVGSLALIVVGLGYGIFDRGRNVLGIDFAGGDNLVLRFAQKVEPDKLRAAIAGLGVPEAQIQFQRDLARGAETLRITSPYGTGDRISAELGKLFPAAKFEQLSLEKVGPTIGAEIMRTAIIASLLSMLGILIYVAVRYEFSFAIGAIVAVVHDILLTLGCYCLTGLFGEGRQFNATMVAAVLTIIGFSLNDKVVIFDRIREDLRLGVSGSFRAIINQALNQTLSRTIITSGTVFLATLALFIFGGGAINDFAFTFLVGIITGTYSSIYIASAFVLWWHERGRRKTVAAPASAAPVMVGAPFAAAQPRKAA